MNSKRRQIRLVFIGFNKISSNKRPFDIGESWANQECIAELITGALKTNFAFTPF